MEETHAEKHTYRNTEGCQLKNDEKTNTDNQMTDKQMTDKQITNRQECSNKAHPEHMRAF